MKLRKMKEQSGFTLIEMLIVVVILGIIAMVVIPQISVSTGDAKLKTLQTNLHSSRGALELYYHQHGQKYPGGVVPATKPSDVVTLADTFQAQLARYTDVAGNISNTYGSSTFNLGPYIKEGKLPTNSFNDKNDVVIDTTVADITVRSSSGLNNGWKFYYNTGVLIPADGGAHDTL